MKKYILFLLLLPFFATFSFSQTSEDTLVRAAFERYRSNLLNDRGIEAVKDVDSKTIQYYTDLLELTKTADSTKIETLSIIDKMSVLLMRLKIPKQELLSFTGRDLFIYSVDHGMVGKGGVSRSTIGKITIDGDFAVAQLEGKAAPSQIHFEFHKENEEWKLDLTSIFPMAIIVFDKLIADSGKSENEFLLLILEAAAGKKVTPETWRPLL